jgi:hypothetical protein
MFCNGVIECIAKGQSSAKSDNRVEDTMFSFLLCNSASSTIERTNLCNQELYQTAAAF